MITMNTAGFSKFLSRLKANVAAGRDRLDPLSPSKPAVDPELTSLAAGFLSRLSQNGTVITTVHVPAYKATGTMPSVPARVLVISQMGEQYFPQEEWDEMRRDGWVSANGRLTGQAERVLARDWQDEFEEPVRVAVA